MVESREKISEKSGNFKMDFERQPCKLLSRDKNVQTNKTVPDQTAPLGAV